MTTSLHNISATAAPQPELRVDEHGRVMHAPMVSRDGKAMIQLIDGNFHCFVLNADQTWDRARKLPDNVLIFDESKQQWVAASQCCAGGPQWGHAWDCPKCPD